MMRGRVCPPGTRGLSVRSLALAALAALAAGCSIYGSPGEGAAGSGEPGGGGGDAGPALDAGADAAVASRCAVTSTTVTCEHQQLSLSDSVMMRSVYYETPLGSPPPSGWPAVVYFQGSLIPGHTAFAAATTDPFGMFDLTLTIKALLDAGYAVLAPDASTNGSLFWETNIPPFSVAWSGCPDDVLMQNLFAALSGGSFGPVDGARLYAMGISSGGFMTSRMAVSYPGRFRALANHSGSYATCSDVCAVPTPLPSQHPPTLFLHGDLDVVVPLSAIQPYLDALQAEGYEASLVTDATAGHQWLAEGPQAIPAWFAAHP